MFLVTRAVLFPLNMVGNSNAGTWSQSACLETVDKGKKKVPVCLAA